MRPSRSLIAFTSGSLYAFPRTAAMVAEVGGIIRAMHTLT
jgi:hypothetical protein